MILKQTYHVPNMIRFWRKFNTWCDV